MDFGIGRMSAIFPGNRTSFFQSIKPVFLSTDVSGISKNVSNLPGKPDIVLPKYKTCIFVNGCFWHKHEGCKYFVWPKNNAEFWKKKITGNVERDLRQQNELRSLSWNVIVIWECELKKDLFEETMINVEEALKRNISSEGK